MTGLGHIPSKGGESKSNPVYALKIPCLFAEPFFGNVAYKKLKDLDNHADTICVSEEISATFSRITLFSKPYDVRAEVNKAGCTFMRKGS